VSIAFLLFGAAAARATPQGFANPDFNVDRGIDGWVTNPVYGTATWAPADANDCADGPFVPSGSLRTASSTTPLLLEIGAESCVNLSGGVPRRLFFEISADPSFEQSYLFTITFRPYALPDCQGTSFSVVSVDGGDVEVGPPSANGYRKVRASYDFNGFVFSARLELLQVHGSVWQGGVSFDWDRAYLGASDPVFRDDFEAQSSCRWSTTQSP